MWTSYFMACGPVAPGDPPVSNGRRFLYRRLRPLLAQRFALLAKWQRRWLRPLSNRLPNLPAEHGKPCAAAATVRRAIAYEFRPAETPALEESAGTAPRLFESR